MKQAELLVPDGFVFDPLSDWRVALYHRDGVPWYEAPVPRRWHRCRIQTWGHEAAHVGPKTVWRCACGAIRFPEIGVTWLDRNTRKRKR